MIQKILFRILMAPFALLYGMGVTVRNSFYRIGFLKEISFSVPVISIGNLTMGGAGKSPHIEYLIRWLKDYVQVATLSRGYKRKSKGFKEVVIHSPVDQVGDEPLQFKRKFPLTGVYVSESRVIGIPKILALNPGTQVILLDDAFQHRSVKPGLNILLTEYASLFVSDFLLPMGRLREWRSAYQRADIVIVTKCPPQIESPEFETIRQKIRLLSHQTLYFSTYRYGALYHLLYPSVTLTLNKSIHALVVSAIANTQYLLDFLDSQLGSVRTVEYEDHHQFTNYEIAQLKNQFEQLDQEKKVIITTEKDAVRLEKHMDYIREQKMPVFVLPVFVSFLSNESEFKKQVQDFMLDFKV